MKKINKGIELKFFPFFFCFLLVCLFNLPLKTIPSPWDYLNFNELFKAI